MGPPHRLARHPAERAYSEVPAQDFSFGPVETKVLSRIRKLSGPFLHRSWLNVPHVTHTDEADITELFEPHRKTLILRPRKKASGHHAGLLMKASGGLKDHPEFNSSLSPAKDSLILKKYYHLGVAVDTPDGLVVPSSKTLTGRGIIELSQELGAVSKKCARAR